MATAASTRDGQSDVGRYQKLERLGAGTYGTVYKAQHRVTGEIFALKKISQQGDEGIAATTLREIALLKTLNHPNVVKYAIVLLEMFISHGMLDYLR